MLQGPLAVWNVSSLLVTNIQTELAVNPGEQLDRACVVPGEFAWDECECGTLLVSPRRFFLTDDFPETSLGRGLIRASPCDLPWLVAEIVIQVIRCAPNPADGQLAPSCDALATAARILLIDAYVTLTETVSTLCELRETNDIIDYVLGEQVTRGPEGSCVGTELNVFVGVPR